MPPRARSAALVEPTRRALPTDEAVGYAPEQVLKTHAEFVGRLQPARGPYLRDAYENGLFYLGIQWLSGGTAGAPFRRAYLRRDVPRPVTNVFKARLDDVYASLVAAAPTVTASPGSDADDDRLTADMARDVISYTERETKFAELKLRTAKALTIYNNAYWLSGYDPDAGTIDRIPKWTCPAHPQLALDARAALASQGMCPKGDGNPLIPHPTATTDLPRGALYTDLVTPFEMWIDTTIELIRDQPIVMRRTLKPTRWIWEKYAALLKSRYGAHDIERALAEPAPGDVGMTFMLSLMRLSAATVLQGTGGSRFAQVCLCDDLYALPSATHPEGLQARLVNESYVVDAKPLATHDGTSEQRGRPFIPLVHIPFDRIPPAHLATGPATHLKPLQRRRNRLQASVELWTSRSANAMLAMPLGAGVRKQMLAGVEGTIVEYNPALGAAAIPRRLEGARLPTAIENQFIQIDNEMKDLAAQIDPLEQAPRMDSGYMFAMASEASKQRSTPLYTNWELAYAERSTHAFLIFRLFAPDEAFFAVKGEEARWSLKKIRRADLRGGVDIFVEPGSGVPRSSIQRKAAMEQAVQLQLVDVASPTERAKVLRAIGAYDLITTYDRDDAAIAREHDAVLAYAKAHFAEDGTPKTDPNALEAAWTIQVNPLLDNHAMHYADHRDWAISEEFQGLPQPVQDMFLQGHLMIHMQILAQQELAGADVSPAGAPRAGSAQGQNGAPPSRGSNGAAQSGPGAQDASARGAGHTGRETRRQSRDQTGGPPMSA